jgi:FeS assembly protein IscX
MSNELTWEHTNKIGILLSNTHPQVEPDKVGLNELHGYVTGLVEFKGDPKHFHEPTLVAIRDAWSTEFQERTRNWA